MFLTVVIYFFIYFAVIISKEYTVYVYEHENSVYSFCDPGFLWWCSSSVAQAKSRSTRFHSSFSGFDKVYSSMYCSVCSYTYDLLCNVDNAVGQTGDNSALVISSPCKPL